MQTKQIVGLVVFLLVLMVACSGITTPVSIQNSNTAFKIPEDSITHYFEAVAQGDTDKILQSCAIDEMSENFKFDLYTERLGGFFHPLLALSPTTHPLYIETNKLELSSQVMNRVKMFVYSLLSSQELGEGEPIMDMDPERVAQFMQDVDPNRLSSLEVTTITLPDETIMNRTQYQELAAKIAAMYGADESTERVALFSFEQNHYYVGFSLLKYGDVWKISSQTSPIAGTSALGTPTETTVNEFERVFGSD